MEPSKLALGRRDPSDESRAPRNRSKTLKGARASRSAREPDYNLLDFGAWKMKELLLRKNVQVDAILRRKSKG